MVEVGHGATTKIILHAMKKNNYINLKSFHSIDPYAKNINFNEDDKVKFLKKKIQDVTLDFFSDIDFLFIDSSHVSKIGSDVNYLILEVLPSLKKNCIVHFHDIYIPYNYQRSNIENINHNMYWNESYFLHAFLLFNKDFKIIYSGKYLQKKYQKFLKNNFNFFSEHHNLTSFYIKKL